MSYKFAKKYLYTIPYIVLQIETIPDPSPSFRGGVLWYFSGTQNRVLVALKLFSFATATYCVAYLFGYKTCVCFARRNNPICRAQVLGLS